MYKHLALQKELKKTAKVATKTSLLIIRKLTDDCSRLRELRKVSKLEPSGVWSKNRYKSVDSYQALRFMQASQQFLASIHSIYLFET